MSKWVGALSLAFVLSACAEGEMAGSDGGGFGVPDARPAGCVSSTDCDDGDQCTQDICDRGSGMCSHTRTCCTSASECDDGDPCTDDTCQDSACKHTRRTDCCMDDSQCDDQNACTQDTCDVSSQMCTHTPMQGCCLADMQCDDGNACTQDSCVQMACTHMPVAGCCNGDGDCDDGNFCTTDTCDTQTHTCSHSPVANCCMNAMQCDDGNVCTTDSCMQPQHQCAHTPVAGCCNADADCNDDDACTADSCDVNHSCVHNAVPGCCNTNPQCDDGNVCTTDTCNTTTHMCTHTGVPNCCTMNSQCDDHNVCNGVETCVNSTCAAGTALNCNDNNACTNDSCDPSAGCQHSAVNCDDGNACTADSCNPASGCAHTTLNCDDGDICTTDGCNFSTGCTHAAVPNCAPRPNDQCANAIDVSNMTDISGSTLGAHDDINPPASCVNNNAAANGGPDVFYKMTITQAEWVSIDTFGSAINTVVYLLTDCNGTVLQLSGQPACNDDSGCNAPDNLASAGAYLLQPGTYYIVVDSYGPGGAGAFNLHIHHTGAACSSAQPLPAFGTPVSGSTSGQANHTNPSCALTTANAPDQMYLFYLCPISGNFQVTASTCSGALTDTVAYIRYGTCTSGDLACDDDGCGIFAGPSKAVAQNVATGGGLYFVIVDSYNSASAGPYTLTVTSP